MRLIILKLLILFSFPLFAQNIIVGNVKDFETKEGLPMCSIFINNSTIGTTSNQNGDFILENILMTEVEIVFRYVGYTSVTKKINFTEKKYHSIEAELRIIENLISEVKIEGKKDKVWEKQLKRFQLAFLGNSQFSKECKIMNPWILDFQELNSVFTAKALEPLKIVNSALGYEIEFEIITFSTKRNNYIIQGNAKFKELSFVSSNEVLKWKKNRELAYINSSQFFFKSLIENRLKENGIEIFIQNPSSNSMRTDDFYNELDKSIIKYDGSKSVNFTDNPLLKKITLPENIEIHNTQVKNSIKSYANINHAVSWISLISNNSVFNNIGQPQIPSDIIVSGEMNVLKFSGLLPLDYELGNLFLSSNSENLSKIKKEQDRYSETNQNNILIPENICINTNKSVYTKGEIIWFKTYQIYPESISNNVKSGVIYIDLFNSDKKLISSKIIKSINGNANGEFLLSDTLKKGKYCLRAYTNYMRNFGDSLQSYFEFNVLDLNERILFRPKKENTFISEWLITKQDTIKSEQLYKVSLKANNNSSYSIAVINELSSPMTNMDVDKFDFSKNLSLPIKYPKELIGRSFQGLVLNNPNANLWNFDNNLSNSEIYQSDSNGEFRINNIVQNDSIKIILMGSDNKGKALKKISLSENKKPEFLYNYKTEKINIDTITHLVFNRQKNFDYNLEKIITLDEIEVKDKKYINPILEKERRILGNPNLSFSTEDLIKTSSPNILMALTSKVPNLKMVYNVESHTLDLRWTRPGGIFPLVPKIWLDGFEIMNPADIQHITPDAIAKIDIYKGPITVASAQTMISIYTKTYLNEKNTNYVSSKNKNTFLFSFLGFSIPKLFPLAVSKDSSMINELKERSTIYWNPNIFTDESGKAEIEFFAIGKSGKYRIEIVGHNLNGIIEKQIGYFTIIE